MKEDISVKMNKATKWSSITELCVKLISPITNMILARLLAPEAFGIIATVNMVITFTDLFADAGFQKYIVQHEYKDRFVLDKSSNVAFWTNLCGAVFLWIIITVFRNPIATAVGNPGLGNVIAIACIQLPLMAFSSVQNARYRRAFDFRTLFFVRMAAVCMPLVVTIPLAWMGFGYWALIIGAICDKTINAIILTLKSEWKPSRFFSFKLLKEMFSFSIWTLIESIAIWLTAWIDILIISNMLSNYYLGLYKQSLNIVNAIMLLTTASVTPILFSGLSRLQGDQQRAQATFLNVQRVVAFFVFPLGAGMFLYSDMTTRILLGSQWTEASSIIGIWALTSAIRIVMTSLYSEVYRASGRPKISLLCQVISLIFLIPACLISLKYGFWSLIYTRALIRIEGVIIGLVAMQWFMHYKAMDILRNVSKPMLCTFIMIAVALGLQRISSGFVWSLVSIGLCIMAYVLALLVFALKEIQAFKKFIFHTH